MKTLTPVLGLALLSACSAPAPSVNPASSDGSYASPSSEQATSTESGAEQLPPSGAAGHQTTTATGRGTIEAIDPAAKTITISHGPIKALQWPAMTMTFKAPDVDLGSFKAGDTVEFDLSAGRMEGTITRISKH